MINLSYFKTAIKNNVLAVQQCIMPERVTSSAVDTSALITSLLEPKVGSQVYPYKLPVDPVYPAITYEQTSGSRSEIDGYVITEHDVFMLSIHADKLSVIIDTVASVEDALLSYAPAGSAGSIEITDKAVTWHETLKRYEAALEINIIHLALPAQTLPAVYIYPLHDEAVAGNHAMNCVTQIINSQFVLLTIDRVPETGVTGIRGLLSAIRDQVLGKQEPAANNTRAQYVKGSVAGLVGQIVIWRDVIAVSTTQHH